MPDRDFVLDGLLQHNFLPMQKEHREEMPPMFSSRGFSRETAKALARVPKRSKDWPGYDSVEYRLNRYDGAARLCLIPHPRPYAELALCIHENWPKLEYIVGNASSQIRPRQHRDGRILVMDYERAYERSRRTLRSSFGRRFQVRADISNFFPSIYSHALCWAAVGLTESKKRRAERDAWFNRLDACFRHVSRDETNGVAIGPATSNIAAEMILARIDEKLRAKKFWFTRFIDDYTAHCRSEEQAQEFIRTLSDELMAYRLALNIRKTEVSRLPVPIKPDWIVELGSLLQPGTSVVSSHEALLFLDGALELSRKVPDGSVLKYAVRTLTRRGLEDRAALDVLRYVINLSFHHPILIPLLGEIVDVAGPTRSPRYGRELERLAKESATYRRSDGLAWSLYLMHRFGLTPSKKIVDATLASRDCVALLVLFLSDDSTAQAEVVRFAKGLPRDDHYELDRYWLLSYELFARGQGRLPGALDPSFSVLKKRKVSFVRTDWQIGTFAK